jgi:hypothetical protein
MTGADEPSMVGLTHIFLTAKEVIARYGWGRTKGYRVLHSEGFPRPIGGDRYRLDTLIDWCRPTRPMRTTASRSLTTVCR